MHVHRCTPWMITLTLVPTENWVIWISKDSVFSNVFSMRCLPVSLWPYSLSLLLGFTQAHHSIQNDAAHGDQYQRLQFPLPDCVFVLCFLPSELKISVWLRKTPFCHNLLQLRNLTATTNIDINAEEYNNAVASLSFSLVSDFLFPPWKSSNIR